MISNPNPAFWLAAAIKTELQKQQSPGPAELAALFAHFRRDLHGTLRTDISVQLIMGLLEHAEAAGRSLGGSSHSQPRRRGILTKLKPGPKRDVDTARTVERIVREVAGCGPWKKHLEKICLELDDQRVRIPKRWPKRDYPIKDWSDAANFEPGLARKAISHHLKNAAN